MFTKLLKISIVNFISAKKQYNKIIFRVKYLGKKH